MRSFDRSAPEFVATMWLVAKDGVHRQPLAFRAGGPAEIHATSPAAALRSAARVLEYTFGPPKPPDDEPEDTLTDESSDESFPASDPPARTVTTGSIAGTRKAPRSTAVPRTRPGSPRRRGDGPNGPSSPA